MRALQTAGVRLGILTNGSSEQQVAKLRAIGAYELVDVVLTAEYLGFWKPDVRAFEALARRLEVEPAQCLFVGDHPEQDIAGAIAAGMNAALIDRYTDDAASLEAVVGLHPILG
ncbi:MAG: HAD family hydrolase [Actinomycetales bacterium]